MYNDYPMKSSSELSEYQKRIENIDTVILCVAEAEKMIRQIGSDLVPEVRRMSEKQLEAALKLLKPFIAIRSATGEPVKKKPAFRDARKSIARILYISDVDLQTTQEDSPHAHE